MLFNSNAYILKYQCADRPQTSRITSSIQSLDLASASTLRRIDSKVHGSRSKIITIAKYYNILLTYLSYWLTIGSYCGTIFKSANSQDFKYLLRQAPQQKFAKNCYSVSNYFGKSNKIKWSNNVYRSLDCVQLPRKNTGRFIIPIVAVKMVKSLYTVTKNSLKKYS